MSAFPLCIPTRGQTVILVGTGPLLTEKTEKLLPFDIKLHIYSQDALVQYQEFKTITLHREAFTEEVLAAMPLFVVSAGLPVPEAEQIGMFCKKRNIPFNAVDLTALCTFFFPSMICRGDCTIAISTDGKSPAIAVRLREKIESVLPDDLEAILDWAGTLRSTLPVSDPALRRKILKRAVADAMEKGSPLTDEELTERISHI